MIPKFCPACAAPLDADARFCPSCRASVGVASALASEITGSLKAGVRSVVREAGGSVPPFVWAAALQIYWLLIGACSLVVFLSVVLAGMGGIGALSAFSSGLTSAGGSVERLILMAAVGVMGGMFDICLSIVAVYGFLNLKDWAYGVFVVWASVKVVLGALTFLLKPSFGKGGDTPFIIVFVVATAVILNIAALVVEYTLVKKGDAALAES